MRGLFLKESLEFRLEVPGDIFTQQSQVACTLFIKNRGSSDVRVDTPTIHLTLGHLKKIKSKDESAFEILQSAELERGIEVQPGTEVSLPHTFSLDANFPITDKQQSPYLLYGDSTPLGALGHLLLTVHPHPHIRALFDTLTTAFSFINKGETSKNGWTSVKLKPPESRKMSFVEELNLSARFVQDSLELEYLFTIKKFDTSMTTVDVKKSKTKVAQALPASEYLFGGNFLCQEYIEQQIELALNEVSSNL